MKKLYVLLCVIALPLILFACDKTAVSETIPETTQTPIYTQRQWTPIYNDHSCGIMAQWADSECASQVDLTTEEIRAILPGKQLDGVTYTGQAHLKKDGSILRVLIWVEKGDAEAFIAIGSDSYHFACCISREPDAESCLCGDLQYKIYEGESILFAEAVCNEYPILINVRADVNETVEADRALFEEILESFSWYEKDEPNLGTFTPSGIK